MGACGIGNFRFEILKAGEMNRRLTSAATVMIQNWGD
jgi:hypothetical protein